MWIYFHPLPPQFFSYRKLWWQMREVNLQKEGMTAVLIQVLTGQRMIWHTIYYYYNGSLLWFLSENSF